MNHKLSTSIIISSSAMRSSFAFLLLLLSLSVPACEDQKPQSTAEPKTGVDSGVQPAPPLMLRPPARHKYEVSSGIIEYDNSLTTGPEKLYFDGYGAREAYYSQPAKSGGSARVVTIYDNGWKYQYDVDNKIGEKRQVPMPNGPIVGAIPDVWNSPKETWSAHNVQELEPRTFLGHESIGYSFDYNGANKVWLWKGIPMYLQMKVASEESSTVPTLQVRSIHTDIDLPQYAFRIPDDVRITERKLTRQ